MQNQAPSHRFWLLSLVLLLVVSNLLWLMQYRSLGRRYVESEKQSVAVAYDTQVLDFTRMFIDKVLSATGEIDFDTRLALENGVRDLKDPEILAAWQAFLASKTEADAQDKVRDFLSILVSKIRN